MGDIIQHAPWLKTACQSSIRMLSNRSQEPRLNVQSRSDARWRDTHQAADLYTLYSIACQSRDPRPRALASSLNLMVMLILDCPRDQFSHGLNLNNLAMFPLRLCIGTKNWYWYSW